MRITILVAVGIGILALTAGTAAVWRGKLHQTGLTSSTAALSPKSITPHLALRDLLESGPKLRPSEQALALNGERVRLAGFMAQMEDPIKGGFYLVARPMNLDESGAGTGDLPPNAVLVLIPGAEGRAIPQLQGALEGVGRFEVGNRSDAEGRVSNFRLILDSDPRLTRFNSDS